ncbi:MAG: hypothetical protein KBA13_12000 [Chitinophagales bacterium]|nr:hypothetical protein [Chitinophagales bacterium]
MKDGRKKIVVFLYNSFKDPVIQSNLFLYLKHTNENQQKYRFHIISFEQNAFKLSTEEELQTKLALQKIAINWTPLTFTPGGLMNKLMDFSKLIFVLTKLRVQGYKYLITLNSVAGAIGYVFSLFLRFKLYMYQYEPHSEFGVDGGLWTEKSLKFKVLNKLEYLSAKYATVISNGTVYMLERLKHWKVKAHVFKIPSVVNEDKFQFTQQGRAMVREKCGIPMDKHVILYPGKFGDLYYSTQEVASFFNTINKNIPNCFFMVLTMNDLGETKKIFEDVGLEPNQFLITRASYDEMPNYLSAADLGLVAVPPQPSKKFCSNIKVGEFLCTGLPYFICEGVSEDDLVARKFDVGIPMKDLSTESTIAILPMVEKYLAEDKATIVARCRPAGSDYRGFNKLILEFGKALDALTK